MYTVIILTKRRRLKSDIQRYRTLEVKEDQCAQGRLQSSRPGAKRRRPKHVNKRGERDISQRGYGPI